MLNVISIFDPHAQGAVGPKLLGKLAGADILL